MKNDWLRKFLNIYWLRPENAMWRAVNCTVLEELGDFAEPSLDLSCGDGVFSFLRAGGDFSLDFDIFSGVGNLDRFFENVDIYNSAPEEYAPVISAQPRYKMTVGSDWKQALLDKAAPLDFYRELVEHDNNKPLPFPDNHFKTIFSNSVYWIPELELHLKEIVRVLHPEGQAVIVLKTDSLLGYNLDQFEPILGEEWLKMIDRGRRANKANVFSQEGWTEQLQNAGFKIIKAHPQATWVHAHIWDVGFRPLSPLLIEMSDAISPEKRREIKARWIDLMEKLLAPFSVPQLNFGIEKPAAEVIFVLGKA